jgi:hypothetical protein
MCRAEWGRIAARVPLNRTDTAFVALFMGPPGDHLNSIG